VRPLVTPALYQIASPRSSPASGASSSERMAPTGSLNGDVSRHPGAPLAMKRPAVRRCRREGALRITGWPRSQAWLVPRGR
jgi:hypothetical protein